MKNTRFITNAVLTIAISISFAAGAFAQTAEMLVAGDPPFTRSDFEAVVKFYERGLDIAFSEEERVELQSKITELWRKNQKSNSRNLVGFMKNVERINSIDGEKIKANQREFADALLGDLKTMSQNGFGAFVTGVYENARRGDSKTVARQEDEETPRRNETRTAAPAEIETARSAADRDEPDFRPVEGAVKMSDLVGKWDKGTVASYGYRNSVTGDYKSGYGSANLHEIRADGSFDYANYAQVSLYGCTTELSTSMKGRAAINGPLVTFNYISGRVRGKDSCKPEGFDKPAQINRTTYRLERGGGHLRLCEVGRENPNCLYKAEK